MFKLVVSYPERREERLVLDRMTGGEEPVRSAGGGCAASCSGRGVRCRRSTPTTGSRSTCSTWSRRRASRVWPALPIWRPMIEYGASPRAGIFLLRAAKGYAALARPRLRDAGGHQGARAGRAPPPRDPHLPGRRRGHRPRPGPLAHSRGRSRSLSLGVTPEAAAAEVRRIEITTRHLVRDIVAGEYASAFRGRGVEFAEVREYQPGDDIRSIDWNVTARLGAAYVKRHLEERELTVMFAVDYSASGTVRQPAPRQGRHRARGGGGAGARRRPEQRSDRCAVLHRSRRALHPAAEGTTPRAPGRERAPRLRSRRPADRSRHEPPVAGHRASPPIGALHPVRLHGGRMGWGAGPAGAPARRGGGAAHRPARARPARRGPRGDGRSRRPAPGPGWTRRAPRCASTSPGRQRRSTQSWSASCGVEARTCWRWIRRSRTGKRWWGSFAGASAGKADE